MSAKNIGINCHDCNGSYMVSVDKAYTRHCPNCHSANIEVLDELPEG